MGVAHNSVAIWDGVEERFRKRLAMWKSLTLWKRQFLSKGGRITLIRDTLSRDGRRVRFWEDRWCGDEALSLSFPSLYALVTSKEAWVVEVWDASGEEGGWNPRFSRPFNEWQMEMVERFLFSLQGKRAVTNLGDRIQWKEAKDGNISVNSFYSAMEGSSTIPFLKSIICSTFIPTKIGFFAWEASCNKALTLDQLKKRGWYFLNKCYLFVLLKNLLIIF
ncbi:hypothetical protein CK203_026027 [Vitis vinifera]|uniref:Reverse transcriptase zinc-binding domain-containing protein n=1 Tax=Vitis vinifera TaxID=29760 RepID=A0A438IJE6_VITVI|nr:hypothetical protein CK203_026027 [Vitis vinifera]